MPNKCYRHGCLDYAINNAGVQAGVRTYVDSNAMMESTFFERSQPLPPELVREIVSFLRGSTLGGLQVLSANSVLGSFVEWRLHNWRIKGGQLWEMIYECIDLIEDYRFELNKINVLMNNPDEFIFHLFSTDVERANESAHKLLGALKERSPNHTPPPNIQQDRISESSAFSFATYSSIEHQLSSSINEMELNPEELELLGGFKECVHHVLMDGKSIIEHKALHIAARLVAIPTTTVHQENFEPLSTNYQTFEEFRAAYCRYKGQEYVDNYKDLLKAAKMIWDSQH